MIAVDNRAEHQNGGGLLVRVGAADQIVGIIEDRILDGRLHPGAKLREVELATEFNVSRNTIREALRLLTRDGLAAHAVHRGVNIREHTADEVRDLYRTRSLIQGEVAARAGSLTPGEFAFLSASVEAGRQALQDQDSRRWLSHNVDFHQQTIALLNNARIQQIFQGLMRELRLVMVSFEQAPSGDWDDDNSELLALLTHGTPDQFRSLLGRYLDRSKDAVLKAMAERSVERV